MNTRKSHKLYKRHTITTFKSLTATVSTHLYSKYFEDFNFYFAKPITEIIAGINSREELRFVDYTIFDSRDEVLRRYYNNQESNLRLSNYASYYAELDDYLMPHTELHTQRKIMFKKRKRKYKLKSRGFEQSRTNQSVKRIKRRDGVLNKLDKDTVYLEDANVSNTVTMNKDMSSYKVDNDYRLDFVKGLEFDEVHDIYDPVFSSDEENQLVRPTVTTIVLEPRITDSNIFNHQDDSIITRLSELEKGDKSKIDVFRVSTDSMHLQDLELLDLLSQKLEERKFNIVINNRQNFKRKLGIETEINQSDRKSLLSDKKSHRNDDNKSRKSRKHIKMPKITLKEDRRKDPSELFYPLNNNPQNKVFDTFLNFTINTNKTHRDNKLFKTTVDNKQRDKSKTDTGARNKSHTKKTHDKLNIGFPLNISTERNSQLKSFKESSVNERHTKNNTGSNPFEAISPYQYLTIQEAFDHKRKLSQNRVPSNDGLLKLSLINKKGFLTKKLKLDDQESKPMLSSYVKSLLQQNKCSSGSNTLSSLKKKEFITKLTQIKKESTTLESKGVLNTMKDMSGSKGSNTEAFNDMKRFITSSSNKRLKSKEKLLPERFYNNQKGHLSKNRNTSPENLIDEYNYYQSVKRDSKKTLESTKHTQKETKSKGSLLQSNRNTSQSNSKSVSSHRLIKVAIKNASLRKKNV